jgi:formate dehydrogenase accessory protein FdhE
VPYVPVVHPPRAEVLASAERRWHALIAAKPDLNAAVDLQRGLLTLVIDLAQSIDGGRLPRLSLPPKYLAAKLSRGVPVLAGEPIPLPAALLKPALVSFCTALATGGAGEVATHIAAAIESDRIDAGSLLTASLTRDQDAIRTAATHMGLAPDLAWLVAELGVGPVAYALQRTLFAAQSAGPLADALAAWNHGYCPACGSWPALAEVVSGHRLLRCAFCAAAWERTIYACVYCDESGEAFVTAAPDEERTDRRTELCSSCGAYLKTIDAEEASPFPLVAIADMETMDLDLAAMEHHYGRPALKAFKTAR